MKRFLRIKLAEVYFLTIGQLALALSIWRTLDSAIALAIATPVAFYVSKAVFGCFFPRLPDSAGAWPMMRAIATASTIGFGIFAFAFVSEMYLLLPLASLLFGMTDAYYTPSVNALIPRIWSSRLLDFWLPREWSFLHARHGCP